ncbi:BLUF domain-containing protein [Magnetospira sp. QH-2]|uniref:BLUF domain-containing protein n=1 Tax=Magnetospira sp. (strain QH-2) TaxID=1288970 RepID=UPI0003E81421|nr:BLUF domain-containing protein [Magnetospira sp. QH-2]CCQ73945.1 Blue-light sensor using FAD (BLUF) [Magnetospira sp. QH-2]
MPLSHVIYSSVFQDGLGQTDLEAILKASREKNAALGLTGILIHADGLFVQLLEGESHHVNQVLDSIITDPRHWQIHVLLKENIGERSFPDWTMAFMEEDLIQIQKLLDIEGAISAETMNGKLQTAKGWPPLFLEYYSNKFRQS